MKNFTGGTLCYDAFCEAHFATSSLAEGDADDDGD